MRSSRLLISILLLSLLSLLSDCRLLGTTTGKIFSSLVPHTRDHNNNNNEVEVEDHGNRRCFNKVMLVEQLEYQDVETCNHSYDKTCHQSYVTRYTPYQQEECSEQYKKVCQLRRDQIQLEEMVEVCRTALQKNCSSVESAEPEECRTMYESECWTKYELHEVEDDVPECRTVTETHCDEAGSDCVSLPREECTLERRTVQKTTPLTGCDKVARLLCSTQGCQMTEGPVECREEARSQVVDRPVEDCQMSPIRVCRPVTKMVPKLEPTEVCMDVPKEICSQSKINPKRVKRPVIKKVCMKKTSPPPPAPPSPPPPPPSPPPPSCSACRGNLGEKCDVENYPYTSCHYCSNNTCVPGCLEAVNCPQGYQCETGVCRSSPGKVLVQSVNIQTGQCLDCQAQTAGVRLSLRGEFIGEFINGTPCSTNLLHHEDSVTTFLAGEVATWTGMVEGEEMEEEQVKLGACYKAPLNAQVTGGLLEWRGPGQWSPASVCVDWRSSNMAWVCQPVAVTPNIWSLQNCGDVRPTQKCSNYYNITPASLR